MADIVKNDKQYVDIAYLKEFWKRIKLLPGKNGTKYTCTIDEKLGTTTNPDTIVGHLESLYQLAADAAAKDVVVSDGGVEGKSITVTETEVGGVKTYTVEIDANYAAAITKAIAAAADAFKGQTTLSADGTDLTEDDITITLGGDGANSSTDSFIIKKIEIPEQEEQQLSGGGNAGNYGESVDITLSGVGSSDGSSVTINMPSAQELSGPDEEAAFGGSQTITLSDDGGTATITIPELTATSGTDVDGYVSVGLEDGTISVSTTTTTGTTNTDTALATDGWVLDKIGELNGEQVVVASGKATSGTSVGFSKDTDATDEKYYVNLTSNDGTTVYNIELDATDFVKDSFLQGAKMGTGTKANYLILTMKLADGTTKDIEVDLSKFIDAYTAADKSIDITNNTVKVNFDGGYLKLNTNGIGVDTTKLQGYAATEASTGDNNIATKKYVDDKAKDANVTVTATDVTTFGATGTVNIKTGDNDTTGTTFTVTLPSFTAGTQDENVKVSIANDGKISTEVTSQAGDTTHTDKALAQKGYVDQKFDEAKAAVTGGTSTADLITVTTAATTATPTVSATLTTVTGKTNTAIATKEFVEDSVSNAKVGYASTTLNISESTTDGKTTVTLNAPIATWSDSVANTDFPFN